MGGNYFSTPNMRCQCGDGRDGEKWIYLRDIYETGSTGLSDILHVVGKRKGEVKGDIQEGSMKTAMKNTRHETFAISI